MPVYRVEMQDGRAFDIDADTPEALNAAVAQLGQTASIPGNSAPVTRQAQQQATPAATPSDDSRLRGFALGVYEPLDNLNRRFLQTDVGQAINSAGVAIGLPDSNTNNAARAAARANNSRTGYQTVGNIFGTAPTMALPGGAVVQGAATGAVMSREDTLGGVARDATIGGIAGKVGDIATRAVAGVVAPQVSRGLRLLNDAGVPLTLGQMAGAGRGLAGRIAKGIEDRAAGLPVVGDLVNNARQRGVEAYNRAVLRRAVGRAGVQLPDNVPVGREGIRYVGDQLSAQYQQLLPRLSARPDAGFAAGLQRSAGMVATVPREIQDQYQTVLRRAFENKATGPSLQGQNLKAVEESLTDFVSRYKSAANPDQRVLAEAIEVVRDELRALVVRQNGAAGSHLQRINRGWRELAIAESAGNTQGNATGIFTPKQYAAAARMADSSVRRRATVRGTAANQPMTDAASDILPNTVPDSGTTGRAALVAGGAGAGYGAGLVEPTTLAIMAGVAAPYTSAGQRAVNWLYFANRPALVRRGAELLRRSAPVVGTATAVGATNGRTNLR